MPKRLPQLQMPLGKILQPLTLHNSINRLTGTTGESDFAPYSQDVFFYYPETKLALFALIDETATDIGKVANALENIGKSGFGRDASIGMGRFEVCKCEECKFPMLMRLSKGKRPWIFCFNPQCPTNKESMEKYQKRKEEEAEKEE